MPDPSTVVATPRDPLRGYQFRIMWAGKSDPFAGVRSLTGLSWTLSKNETWSGGNNDHPYVNPNRLTWEPIVLEQGIALDSNLVNWADAARKACAGLEPPVAYPIKQDVVIEVPREHVLSRHPHSFIVYNAWVSKFVALPKLDSMSSEIALLTVELTHEGWAPQW